MGEYICPNCQNPIYEDEAILCHFCGESLKRSGQGLLSKLKYKRPQGALIIIVSFIVLSFLFLVLR